MVRRYWPSKMEVSLKIGSVGSYLFLGNGVFFLYNLAIPSISSSIVIFFFTVCSKDLIMRNQHILYLILFSNSWLCNSGK